MKKIMVKFTDNGIEINGTEKPLYSGAVHYWRIGKKNWSKILDEICDMGFEMIETYIPWCVHEYEEGKYDFGEIEENKDLDGFLDLCEEKKLSVIVRPGPHINAELNLFGYPQWILHDENIQAKNPWGTTVVYPYVTKQFPIPSYASEKLYEKMEKYLWELAPVLQRHTGEKGCIIAIQADNETCNFFRDRPYVMDYSKDSIRLYHHFLKGKYMTIHNLNKTYGSDYTDFKGIIPPTGFQGEKKEDLPYYFDWVEYKEEQILYALKRMTGIIEKLNLSVPVFHNCAYQNYTPISIQRDEEIPGLSVAGMDAYQEPDDTSMLKERIRYLAGSSRLPFVPEFGSGSWFDRECLLTEEEEEYGYLYSLMNGLKAVNFYMLVERDRWTGCPITVDGRIRENYYHMFKNMITMLQEEKIYQYQRRPRILILKNYDMGRFKALYSRMDVNALSSNCFITGPELPPELFIPDTELERYIDQDTSHYAREEWIIQAAKELEGQHFDFNYSDQYLKEEKWEEYDVIFASTYDFLEKEMQEKLVRFGKTAGKKLILGPKLPYMDRDFRECTILKEALEQWKASNIAVLSSPAGFDYDSLDVHKEYIYEASDIEISVHYAPPGQEHLLFIANHSRKTQSVRLNYQGRRNFRSIWRGEGKTQDNMLITEIPPYTVSIWKAEIEEKAYDKQ